MCLQPVEQIEPVAAAGRFGEGPYERGRIPVDSGSSGKRRGGQKSVSAFFSRAASSFSF